MLTLKDRDLYKTAILVYVMEETMGKRQFKAETKQLLDLMINSIYTNREIFLRELISNSSDAIDKLKFKALTDQGLLGESGELSIEIDPDKENKTITIRDNGIGMTYDEVVENIGTIARSGSKEFFKKLEENDKNTTEELIGQFGVGFYSAFMVAEKVRLRTKAAGADTAEGVEWISAGDGHYTIEKTEVEDRGTEITLFLRDDLDMNITDEFEIEQLVKKYSDYIRYPVMMDITKEVPEEKDEKGKVIKEKELVVETKTLNSMKPIWIKNKSDVEDSEYADFYKHAFHAYDEPFDVIQTKGEGTVEYNALIFIPSKAPFDFYSNQFERGIKLYSKQVFIMEKCKELIPEYLGFVKGIVDSPDFSLNISREILQQDRQLSIIGKNVEKKILQSLKYTLENERDKYVEFWGEFGRAIKAGVYAGFGVNKDKLQDLLLFESSNDNKMTTLAEYVERMPEDQKEIYFATGASRNSIEKIPQMEMLKDKGYEVLFFTDKIDEFTSTILLKYKEKPLKNIAGSDLDLDSEEEKKEKKEKRDKLEERSKDLLENIKNNLEGKVAEVRLSSRLKNSAVCLVSGSDGISLNMEQVLSEASMSDMPAPKASRILEINPEHALFEKLNTLNEQNSRKLKDYSELLYQQALVMEGIMPTDPVDFASKIADLMTSAE